MLDTYQAMTASLSDFSSRKTGAKVTLNAERRVQN
jgi:hypothetical protein